MQKYWFYFNRNGDKNQVGLEFFNSLFIVALTARSYRDRHCFFSVWEWYFYWYIQPQQSHMSFFLIHGRQLSGRIQSSLRATIEVNNHEFRHRIYHERHLSGRVQSSLRARPPMWTIMRSGNRIYELLYEFTLHCLLCGNLSIRSSRIYLHFWGLRARQYLGSLAPIMEWLWMMMAKWYSGTLGA